MNNNRLRKLLAIGVPLTSFFILLGLRSRKSSVQSTTTIDQPPLITNHSSLVTHHSSRITRHASLVTRHPSLDSRLFLLAILVFALTRFIGLTQFPIYFFTDEAIQTVQAADYLHHNFRDANGDSWPTYFQNGSYYNLSISVYAQLIPYILFGFSDFVTRAVSVLIALSGTAAIGLMLRDIFKVRWWWIGTLVLSITPAWFLHSRTAFETAEATAFYAWFIYFYLRYRYIRPRNLIAALFFGAVTFYTYSPAQLIVVATGALMLLSDIRYHLRTLKSHPTVIVSGIILLAILAVPYIRFQSEHPQESFYHLRILNSYLTDNTRTTSDKLNQFIQEYTYGLNPAYWYSARNTRDLLRHQMKGYGNLWWPTLPFALIGLLICLRKIRSPMHRAVLIALLAAPIGGAMVQVQVYRALMIVIPIGLLTSIGVIAILSLLIKRIDPKWIAIGSFAVLSSINFYMLNDALTNGPTWYVDYGLGGLQYGARQVFTEVERVLADDPASVAIVSPTWANGTDVMMRFYTSDDPRVRMGNIEAFITEKLLLTQNILFVMTRTEYQRALNDPRFTDIHLTQTLKYPNGADGFYFVRLNYSAQADAIFAADRAARHTPIEEDITLNGQTVHTLHSQFDVGRIQDLFDGDAYTLIRTDVDNPAIVELTFTSPQSMRGLALTTGTMDFTLTVTVYSGDVSAGQVYSQSYTGLPNDPTVTLSFGAQPIEVQKIRIEVKDDRIGTDNHIHIREVQLIGDQ
jgi:4-amino-4-deoxy-L-arabinose transferase-like glycosyltransferase